MKQRIVWSWAIAILMLIGGNVFAEDTGKEVTDRLKQLEERMGVVEKGASSISINGFVDTYYSYNFNKPDSNMNKIGAAISNFDIYHNDFSINLAELVFSKTPTDSSPVGFRVDLDYGSTTELVHCGTPSCPGGAAEEPFKNIQQAYVTWATPIHLTLDLGKFVTHMGAEVIESKDNWNYTRGLLFCCAIPYYHAGLRVNYAISDMLFVNAYLLNGWNDVVETNNMKTFGAQIGITPIKQVPIVLNWIGPEQSTAGGFEGRQVYDAIVSFLPTDSLSFMVNYDYGKQDPIGGGSSMKWTGVAAYARWAVDPCAIALRYEWTNDKDNVMYGANTLGNGITTGPKVQEVTVTGEHKVAGNLLVRLEYRHDMADKEIFEKEGATFEKSQNRVVLGAIYSF
ncbi:MAG: porin [Nitrospirae bacterium]|nr:porin [Candidatus Manganitrophaceae bacterium]